MIHSSANVPELIRVLPETCIEKDFRYRLTHVFVADFHYIDQSLVSQVGSCKSYCGSRGGYSCTYSCNCPKTAEPGVRYIYAEWDAMDELIKQGRATVVAVLDKLVQLRVSFNGRVIWIPSFFRFH